MNLNSEENSGNVLSALEKLIEKNFDTKSRRSQQTGILQRLGIDEEVFPPWQNLAPSPISSSISPSMMAAWNPINGMDFSRSSSSNSSNHSRHNSGTPITAIPQLRYRRNSSSTQKDKNLSNPISLAKIATESNGSFSTQETEEESCDDSNSECGNNSSSRRQMCQVKKRSSRNSSPRSSSSTLNSKSRLNFPISTMLSSPIPARPTSASSTASSVSPSLTPSHISAELLNRLTPNSHRSAGETDDDNDQLGSPVFKKTNFNEAIGNNSKLNGINNEGDESDEESDASGANLQFPVNNGPQQNGDKNPTHHPLMQLQKLLDKTNTSGRRSLSKSSNRRSKQDWNDSGSTKSPEPSSPRDYLASANVPASPKSDQDIPSLKCAFCDTLISSRNTYRSHLAKVHLQIRDMAEVSAISDEELLVLVLAKSSNLSLMNSLASSVAQATANQNVDKGTAQKSSGKDSSKRKFSRTNHHHNNNDVDFNDSMGVGQASSKSPSPQLETSQSKFLKYTELAKQLSSKYA
ncbi:hypothetical protein NH340_JMT05387 [Sarcoptes scabiei]|nr:hypothetical protein QR98_0041690 [Sarcoptes scabiei]UXI19444.1 hypothetical protein NH340_JMT05387 [Sarcoptes scabiei]